MNRTSQLPISSLAVALGNYKWTQLNQFRLLFANNGWQLLDETWLKQRLNHLSTQGYENQMSSVVAKLLLRGKP